MGKLISLWEVFSLSLVLSMKTFSACSAASNQQVKEKKLFGVTSSINTIGSSLVFPVRGNVFPTGYYYVDFYIGDPPKPYFLDIDTGSDLTWVHCDAPCKRCAKVPHPLYRPNTSSFVVCPDPLCVPIPSIERRKCENPTDKCEYKIEYADQGSSEGYLVKEIFPLRLTNGSFLSTPVAFGCGYDQSESAGTTSPTDGVLGLGSGKASVLSQLTSLGLIRNVIGHCFSSRGGGFLFLGDDLVPSSGIVWIPVSHNPIMENYYSPGPAEIILGKKSIGVKGLDIVLDSGSSYTYLNSMAYDALISSLMKDLTGQPLKTIADETLPICWKGKKPFKSMIDVKKYFKPVIISFTDGKKAQMEIPPESYLILSEYGNLCLGILNGTEIDLPFNIIGDNFFQDKVVIYDNEKQQIGWGSADCSRPSKVDVDKEGISLPYSDAIGTLREEYCPATSPQEDIYELKKDEL